MADYTVSTNLISWIAAQHGEFGWPDDGREAEIVRGMRPGDLIVPKFAQYPVSEGQETYQQEVAAVYHPGDPDPAARYREYRNAYEDTVAWGDGAVPFVMRVVRQLGELEKFPSPVPWTCVSVDLLPLDYPLSTSEYLHARVVPVSIASQFKAMAAPNRHVQSLPDGAAEAILRGGAQKPRPAGFLRRETLVLASSAAEAWHKLMRFTDDDLHPLDRAFLVAEDEILGLHVADEDLGLRSTGEPIVIRPDALRPLFEEAERKATKRDAFRPSRAFAAADQITAFLESGADVLPIAELTHFHDRYVILPRKVTEALELVRRPEPMQPRVEAEPIEPEDIDEDQDPDIVTEEQLQGLSVEAAEGALPAGMAVPRAVLAEAVTALRAGKHLLLSGPPGTGKSTIAAALCRAVVSESYRVATATADWTTFDTIGGYLPQAGSELVFEPGLVLRCLDQGEWLIIDELNRADIDKAFGPLFTLLAGSGEAQETVLLPYRRDKKHVEIAWADAPGAATADYKLTKVWRLIGTMNVADKASLYQLSLAFLRRFAVIDVPLPDRATYKDLIEAALTGLDDADRTTLADLAIEIAFGPVQLGPAIMLDVATFTRRGLIAASSGSAPYDDVRGAFLTAVRLYAVPQYEGADRAHADSLTGLLREALPEPPAEAWTAFEQAVARLVS